jgi:hypothetical protein
VAALVTLLVGVTSAVGRVAAVVGTAGHGLYKDRSWPAIYEARRHTEEAIRIDWSQEVHAALSESFLEWILLEWLQAHGG